LVRTRSTIEFSSGAGRQTTRKPLSQHRTEDGCCEHEHKHDIEHSIVEQPLTGRTERFMRDQCRGKRRGNLWQRERPDRELFIPAVAKRATHAPGRYPLADDQGTDDAGKKLSKIP
jgi:hypothetical protein